MGQPRFSFAKLEFESDGQWSRFGRDFYRSCGAEGSGKAKRQNIANAFFATPNESTGRRHARADARA
jgi:hypothetical protein